ncbi:hypothetical protein M947_05730 [Sulfurimonas hongkongensis]|uniref:Serine hydrolase family protein n=1 Tax=Sulfurimonas hongkongensis TaxID=1172190 RepID=T0KR09_9BACT|nr:alpha/beta hydrolase [Sulfurimonas hongkongensis]EQB39494.1 hypothetical protein M947_05730 [Sulfurimonas hongkongensis]
MKKKVLLLHGWGGSDTPHWQSYIAAEIARDYGCVSFLKLPDFESPDKDIWIKETLRELREFRANVVVCHSLANTLWFHMCNSGLLEDVENLFLVAPPSLNSKIDELKNFFPVEVPKDLHAKKALLVCSDDDPYMSMKEARELQSKLGIEIKVLEKAGHINADSGFGEWEWMLKKIKSL